MEFIDNAPQMSSLSQFTPAQIPTLLTSREVGEICRVDRRTVERWAQAGVLHRVEIGGSVRFRADDVARLIEPKGGSGSQ